MTWNEAMEFYPACQAMARTWADKVRDPDAAPDLAHDLLIYLVEQVDISRAHNPKTFVDGILWRRSHTFLLGTQSAREHRKAFPLEHAEANRYADAELQMVNLLRDDVECAPEVRYRWEPGIIPTPTPPTPERYLTVPFKEREEIRTKERARRAAEKARRAEQKARRKAERAPKPCGTRASYGRGCRCPLCREANAAWSREVWRAGESRRAAARLQREAEREAKRAEREREKVQRKAEKARRAEEREAEKARRKAERAAKRTLQPCGTRAAYQRGCRCESCCKANRAYAAAQRARRATMKPAPTPRPKRPVPDHGTESRYTTHKCRCDDCRRARREYMRARNGWKPRRPPVDHGSPGYYRHRGCRCPLCKEAWSAYQRERKARREQGEGHPKSLGHND